MAFNPFVTFQKNKRFWMAAILMICMVSFVFCTGMRGDMSERIPQWFGFGKGGGSVVRIAGRTYTRKDLEDVKSQRNLANAYMRHCNESAYRNADKAYFDEIRKEEEAENRAERLTELSKRLRTLGIRKLRPRYFDGDVKYRDLEEFLLWRAEADRLSIRIDDEHLKHLFHGEFFDMLRPEDRSNAELEARRAGDHRDATPEQVRQAVADEFRVRIAQYAVFTAQPYSFFQRKDRRLLDGKFLDPNMPDQQRALMTLAQIWDFYKEKRSAFTVKFTPVYVEDFALNKFFDPKAKDAKSFLNKKIEDPDPQLLRDFFDAHKNEAYDPTSSGWGLETPVKIKVEYLYADPKSPEYLGVAATLAQLSVTPPLVYDPFQSPLVAVIRHGALESDYRHKLEAQYEAVRKKERYDSASPLMTKDYATPVLEYFAVRHTEAAASLVGAGAMGSLMGGGTFAVSGDAGFRTWGMIQHPLVGEPAPHPEKKDVTVLTKLKSNTSYNFGTPDDSKKLDPKAKGWDLADPDLVLRELDVALRSEAKRRNLNFFTSPEFTRYNRWKYAGMVGTGATGSPLDVGAAFLHFDPVFEPQNHTVDTVRRELESMLDHRTAERWAQENMWNAKRDLEAASGDASKYKRELKIIVPKYNLVYGPPEDKKGNYYDQFSIGAAPEFAGLKESYLKYMHQINLFEGRDTPDRQLTEKDFHKLFFGEAAFVASGKFDAKPWPPEVKANRTRDFRFVEPRLSRGVTLQAWEELRKHVEGLDPTQPVPSLDLFRTAQKPMLYWRTAVIPARRENDYRKIVDDLRAIDDLRRARAGLVILETLGRALGIDGPEKLLRDRAAQIAVNEAQLEKDEADFRFIENRVFEGLKFKRAREEAALPHAKALALELIDVKDIKARVTLMEKHAATMRRSTIDIPNLTEMHAEDILRTEDTNTGEVRMPNKDYFLPSLADGTIMFPHDKTVEQLISLHGLKKPIEVGTREIDDINKDLFEKAKKNNQPDGYVQILTNKPRTIFYVATITEGPTTNDAGFVRSMSGASSIAGVLQGHRDLFIERAQKAHAEQYRQAMLTSLRITHDYKLIGPELVRQIDGERE
ncbi:MAG: hypothetical protein FJ303_11520 [Planctomycetes bacterium]|nr:hypothetical protein [Planctomycetota bacterium]